MSHRAFGVLLLLSTTASALNTALDRKTPLRTPSARQAAVSAQPKLFLPQILDVSNFPEVVPSGKGGPVTNSAPAAATTSPSEGVLPWQLALLGITACWGANFAVTDYPLAAVGGGATEGSLFIASRFVSAAVVLTPFLASASGAVLRAGA